MESGKRNSLEVSEDYSDDLQLIDFKAPELFGSNPKYTKAIDWYALGIMAYEMVIGQTPFLSNSKSILKKSVPWPMKTKEVFYSD